MFPMQAALLNIASVILQLVRFSGFGRSVGPVGYSMLKHVSYLHFCGLGRSIGPVLQVQHNLPVASCCGLSQLYDVIRLGRRHDL